MTIYIDGPLTAKQLGERLSADLKNASVRSMLNRLCTKGILVRKRRDESANAKGRRSELVYFPAIVPAAVQESALRELARDFFDDSLLVVAQTAIELFKTNPPGRPSDAGRGRDEVPASGSAELMRSR